MSGPDELPPAGVAPEEAIRFFRAKGFRIGFSWLDIFREEHARWFTVAKAMTRDLLEDIRAEVDRAIADGITLSDFKKALRPKLRARGWWGKRQMLDPATGQHELVQLGSERRLRTIFDTNLRTAYSAGKWERFQRTKAALPFVEYSSLMDGRERPQHHAWNGTILPIDDPWWDTHWPPCDWNCRCSPVQRSQRMLDRQGKSVTETPIAFPKVPWTNKRTGETGLVEKGIGKGWDYNVGKEYLRGLAPPPLPHSFGGDEEIGAAAAFTGAQHLLVDRFLTAFGVEPGKEAIWTDRDGWPLSIGRGWFLAPGNRAVVPPGGVVLGRIINTIREPDSIRWIWAKGRDGRQLLMRRYASVIGQLGMIVDIGGEGWRWAMVPAGQIAAAYDPHQARDGHGRWSNGLGNLSTELDEPLSADEEHAIDRYTSSGYSAINRAARGLAPDPSDAEYDDDIHALTRSLDRAIGKSRLTRDERVYRGLHGDAVAHLESLNLRNGSIISDPGFTSASKDWVVADRFSHYEDASAFLILKAPAGTRALDVTRSSAVGTGEYEILFPRDAKWKVTRIDVERGVIEAEAVE